MSGSSDLWRQFWNEDGNGRPIKPKCENSCRDILLENPKHRLRRTGVEVIREGSYVTNTRADIRASYRKISVIIMNATKPESETRPVR
ncbi:MAG: hypothetical protein OXI96_03750 [Acidimicrobiaceae bacterium]|nr:hypothetical protein [Acidimicrobiaceae bacterium]